MALVAVTMNSGIPTPSELAHTLSAFFQFEICISPTVLIAIYWLGVLGLPLLVVIFIRKLLHGLTLPEIDMAIPDISDLPVWRRSKIMLIILGLVILLFSELLWRIAIETVLAYFQMRDALVGDSSII